MIILYLSGICSHCLKIFGNGVNKQEAGLVNMPKPAQKQSKLTSVNLKDINMNQEQIARVAHEVNRAYCEAMGDTSQPKWEDAPQWQRDSAILGVNFHIVNRCALPQASHENWMAQKISAGWVYGVTKDALLKQHPCIVPFDQLPPEQQAKDFLFRGVVHALLESDKQE